MSKINPHTVRIEIFVMAITHNTGIQIKQKKLTKTCMMISIVKPLALHFRFITCLHSIFRVREAFLLLCHFDQLSDKR